MSELVAIILAVGALLPLLTSVAQQPRWSNRTRTVVGVLISALAGLVTYVTQYGLDLSNPTALVTAVVGVVLAAAASYRTIWKPAGVAPAIEAKTSPAAEVRNEITTADKAVDTHNNVI